MRRIASVASLGAVLVLAACSQSKSTTSPNQSGELSGTYVGSLAGPMGGGTFTAAFGSAAANAGRIHTAGPLQADAKASTNSGTPGGNAKVHAEGTNPALLNFTLLSGTGLTLTGTSTGEAFSVSDAAGDQCSGNVTNILTATCTMSTSPAFVLQLLGVKTALSGSPVSYCGIETPTGSTTPDAAIFLVAADSNALLIRVAQSSDTGQAFAGTINVANGALSATSLHNTNLTYTGTVTATTASGSMTTSGTTTASWTTTAPCLPTTATLSTTLAPFSAQQGATPLPPSQKIIVASTGAIGPINVDTSFNYQGAAGGWLGVTVSGATVTLAVNTTNLQPATYLATVQLFGALATNNPLLVHVSYVVTGVGPNLLTASPNVLYFVSPPGGSNPPGQVVNFTSTGAPVQNLVQSHTYPGTQPPFDWLGYTHQTTSSTPLALDVTPANTQVPGQYFGSLTETSGSSSATVQITYSVAGTTGNVLLPNPSTLTYTSSSGQNPPNQTFQVTYGGSGKATDLGVQPQYFANTPVSWILLAINSSTTPATVTVQIADSTLPMGADSAWVVVTGKDPSGTNSIAPAVIKIVTHITAPVQQLLVRPDTLQFTTVVGTSPTVQQVTITSGGGAPISNVSVSNVTYAPSGGPTGWLSLFTSGATTPIILNADPVITGFAAGQYTATLTISSTTPGISPTLATVILTVNPVAGATSWTAVTIGNDDEINTFNNVTCGISQGGVSYCWGQNGFGEIGDGSQTSRLSPTPISGNLTFTQLSSGNDYACGIASTTTAYCWGTGYGIGNSGTLPQSSLVPAQAGIGRYSSISTQLGDVDESFDFAHTCAVATAPVNGNTGWCWGGNNLGELGDGNARPTLSPTQISGGHQFVSIAASDTHTCGIDAAGAAWCWGYNFDAEEGVGHAYQSGTAATYDSIPHQVIGGHTFTAIAVGHRTTCAVATGGTMFCWGGNEFGQLGTGQGVAAQDSVPTQVAGTTLFKSIVSGGTFFCALATTGGQLWCWGTPTEGYASALPIFSTTPSELIGGFGIFLTQIAVAPTMICGIDTQGRLPCWGYGYFGDGNGQETVVSTGVPKFVSVPASGGSRVAGARRTVAVGNTRLP